MKRGVGAGEAVLEERRLVGRRKRGQGPQRLVAPGREAQGAGGHRLEGRGHLRGIGAHGQQPADGGGQVAQRLGVDGALEVLPEEARGRRLVGAAGVGLGPQTGREAQERRALEGAEVAAPPLGGLHGAEAQRRAPGEVGGRVAGRLQVVHEVAELPLLRVGGRRITVPQPAGGAGEPA